jgi:hypothetical protein
MTATLSPCFIPEGNALVRHSPRPESERNAAYASQFDWKTLFYDVYRVGEHVVFQAPPFFDFLPVLREAELFRGKFGLLWPKARLVERNRASEIWLREPRERLLLDGPFGHFDIAVQPNLSDVFAGRRVIHTLSKNNDIRWIIDWARYYVAAHGADGVLIYDNASTLYDAAELQDALRQVFPDVVSVVQDWPFRYGPQGGLAGAVDGRETPWDSDYCQTGSMQHARFRYLLRARSVLNVDIDEMVVSDDGRSIFAATEDSPDRCTKFAGAWISSANPRGATAGDCRHADFVLRDRLEEETCPPKWCVVPDARGNWKHTWSVHNLFGAKANRTLSDAFSYRHMKGISNNWKYDRWDAGMPDPERFFEDGPLREAFVRAGLLPA